MKKSPTHVAMCDEIKSLPAERLSELAADVRKHHGISGFPNPSESAHDAFIAGYAGSALAAATGMAAARDRLEREHGFDAVSVAQAIRRKIDSLRKHGVAELR